MSWLGRRKTSPLPDFGNRDSIFQNATRFSDCFCRRQMLPGMNAVLLTAKPQTDFFLLPAQKSELKEKMRKHLADKYPASIGKSKLAAGWGRKCDFSVCSPGHNLSVRIRGRWRRGHHDSNLCRLAGTIRKGGKKMKKSVSKRERFFARLPHFFQNRSKVTKTQKLIDSSDWRKKKERKKK